MRIISSLLAASLVTIGFASVAAAGTAGDNLTVTASVSSGCTITGNTLAFGAYDTVSGAQVDNAASIAVACTTGTDSTVTLDQGSNAGGGSTDAAPIRRMTDGSSNFLGYALFSDSLRTTVWGNTPLTGKGYLAASSAPTNLTVSGRIAANQDVPAGSYTDTVIATITF